MTFDNLNYSTEAQIDEESIQDKIDSQRLEIKNITKENLKELRVDILNGNSSLNIRDAEGNVIGKLKDNQVVNFNGDKKVVDHGGSKKLFLGVDLKDGLNGFIAADYVKGEIKAPVDKTPVDKTPVDKTPVDKTPVDKTPVDKAPVDKAPVLEKISTPEVKERIIESLNSEFEAFKKAANDADQITQSSTEKEDNEKLLNICLNDLISLIHQTKDSNDEDIKNLSNNIQFYLAEYYADEGEIDNDNYSNYPFSNKLALGLLGEVGGLSVPTEPNREDIINSFKGNGVGKYIISELNSGKEISEVFSSSIVKNASEKEGKALIKKYNDDLDEYLETIDSKHRGNLSEMQKKSLDLLMDVNGTGWLDVRNSTTDMWDVMGWDFAAIGAGIGTGFGVGAMVGSPTVVGVPVSGAIGAIAGGIVATTGMMINHGDDYFSEDYKKGLTELGINTATFGVGGAVFKMARGIQGTSHILKSGRGLAALGTEASADVFIGATADMTRAWSNDMNIEFSDAVINNLAWALLPVAMNGKQMFSPSRWKLAEQVVSDQQKATILYKLGDKIGGNKIIESASLKIKDLKSKIGVTKELSSYQDGRFKSFLKKEFAKRDNVKLTDKDGNQMIINKQASSTISSQKFTINDEAKLYTLRQLNKKIGNEFKIKRLDDLNYSQIIKLGDKKEIVLDTLIPGLPFKGRIKLLEKGEVQVLENGEWKVLKSKKEKMELLNDPKIREEILKKNLDLVSHKELFEKISNIKQFKEIKGVTKEAWEIGFDRLKAFAMTGLGGGTITVLLELLFGAFNDQEENESNLEKFLELLLVFAVGATTGGVLSIVKSGTIFTWKGTGWVASKTVKTASGTTGYLNRHKWKILPVIGGVSGYYYFND